ncbi:hypothetical protein H9L39_01326 [Fusarium oxysporum f. sp. albedinis]|nr:hypothetical protein H9L39_01326 [Fusarium oxysporum f. sp. albedinis]
MVSSYIGGATPRSSQFLFSNENVKTEFPAFLSREWDWLLLVAAWCACSKTSKPAYSAQTKAAFISRVRDSQMPRNSILISQDRGTGAKWLGLGWTSPL